MSGSAPPAERKYHAAGASHRELAEKCSETAPLAKLLALGDDPAHPVYFRFNAVYVVSPEGMPVAKVGVATNPVARLQSLQCGNWNKLFMRSLFWCGGNAYDLERAVKLRIAEHRVGILGEWAALEPEDLALLVAKTAKEIAMPIASSELYLDSWLPEIILMNAGRRRYLEEHRSSLVA